MGIVVGIVVGIVAGIERGLSGDCYCTAKAKWGSYLEDGEDDVWWWKWRQPPWECFFLALNGGGGCQLYPNYLLTWFFYFSRLLTCWLPDWCTYLLIAVLIHSLTYSFDLCLCQCLPLWQQYPQQCAGLMPCSLPVLHHRRKLSVVWSDDGGFLLRRWRPTMHMQGRQGRHVRTHVLTYLHTYIPSTPLHDMTRHYTIIVYLHDMALHWIT